MCDSVLYVFALLPKDCGGQEKEKGQRKEAGGHKQEALRRCLFSPLLFQRVSTATVSSGRMYALPLLLGRLRGIAARPAAALLT